jgi:hypothetical protein
LLEYLSEILEPEAFGSENKSFILSILYFNCLQVSLSNVSHVDYGHHDSGDAGKLSLEDSDHEMDRGGVASDQRGALD